MAWGAEPRPDVRRRGLEHGSHLGGDAREGDHGDVALVQEHAGRGADRVVERLRAGRERRHLPPRRGERAVGHGARCGELAVAARDEGERGGMLLEPAAEGPADAGERAVVGRRSEPAGRDDEHRVAPARLAERVRDRGDVVVDHGDAGHPGAQPDEACREPGGVGIDRMAGQELAADGDDLDEGGGVGRHAAARSSLGS